MVAVVFVSNLVKRHPNCRVLLHRANADGITCGSRDFMFIVMHAQKVAYAHVLDQVSRLQLKELSIYGPDTKHHNCLQGYL